jgi:hypothetical protein
MTSNITELFGGAERVKTRPRGFAPWLPQPETLARRAFTGATCQAEALAPDVLAAILRDAIEARIDRRALDRVLKRERQVRRELAHLLRGAPA